MLKLIALLTMTVDHLGYLFFPDQEWMRAVGRLTMPIFGYAIARGFYYTSDKNKYLTRMGILALVSQIPFMILFERFDTLQFGDSQFWVPTLNMIVPWTLALFFLRFSFLYALPFIGILFYVPMDYTSAVILLPIAIYYLWFKDRRPLLALLASVGVLSAIALILDPAQWWSLLAVPFILLTEKYDRKVKLNKWFFYAFYPVHMALLYVIVILTGA